MSLPRPLIFSASSDDDARVSRSQESAHSRSKSAASNILDDPQDCRSSIFSPSTSSQMRSSHRLSARFSGMQRRSSGRVSQVELRKESANAPLSSVHMVEQALVQAFQGDVYIGTSFAAISFSFTSGMVPSLVVEDSKGSLLCQLGLDMVNLRQGAGRPTYLFVEQDSVKRWSLMFQGQKEATRFLVAATVALGAFQKRVSSNGAQQTAVTLYETHFSSGSPDNASGKPADLLIERGAEVNVSYSIWGVEKAMIHSDALAEQGILQVGTETLEEVSREAPTRVVVGQHVILEPLEEALKGMSQSSGKIICFPSEMFPQALLEKRSSRKVPLESTEAPLFLVAWITCVSVISTKSKSYQLDENQRGTATSTIELPRAEGAPADIKDTLSVIQHQLATLQESLSYLNGSQVLQPEEDGAAHISAADQEGADVGADTGLNETIFGSIERSKTPVGPRASVSTYAGSAKEGVHIDPAVSKMCLRSMKLLCNDIFNEIQANLMPTSDKALNEEETEERERILTLIENAIRRKGEEHMEKWKRRVARGEPSPYPTTPRQDGGQKWKGTSTRPNSRHRNPGGVVGNAQGKSLGRGPLPWSQGLYRGLSGGSQFRAASNQNAGDEGAGWERSCSTFGTPPPRAAMLLGSQDFRLSPTPVPLHMDA